METFDMGFSHTCNLVSLNLTKILNDEKLLEKACRYSVRMLDKAIDVTTTPIPESNKHNQMFRTIGVCSMGLADWMAYNKLSYHKEEDWIKVEELYEKIAYYTLDESCNIAQEKGSFLEFENSYFKDGIILGRTLEENKAMSKTNLNWDAIYEKVKLGVRNMFITSIAPNSSCQDGNNKIITKNGNKSVYDILNDEGLDINEIEKQEPYWIKLKNPIHIPTFEGDDVVEQIWWNGHKEFIEIEFEDGKKYKFTYNHKLLVLRNEGYTEWVECRNLKESDEILDINMY